MIRTSAGHGALLFLISFLFYVILSVSTSGNRKRYFISSILGAAVSFLFSYFCFTSVHLLDHGGTLPGFLLIMVSPYTTASLFVLLLTGIILISVFCNKKNSHVSEASIYSGINALKSGLCCYRKGGKPIMVNEAMDDISFQATGGYLYNGEDFRKFLEKNISEDGEIKIKDRYYYYVFRDISVDRKRVSEIILTDITPEHELNEKLIKETGRRYEYQEKLKKYSKDMNDLIRNEEILNAKIKTHAEFGNLLLHGKYSIPHEEERGEFLKSVLNISAMTLAEEEDKNDVAELSKIAHAIGIELHVMGSIERPHSEAVLRMLQECVTNCSKHAKGHNVYLLKVTEEDKVNYICTNDGLAPEKNITEGGGLSAIRMITEKLHGTMRYETDDRFKIILSFEKEDS